MKKQKDQIIDCPIHKVNLRKCKGDCWERVRLRVKKCIYCLAAQDTAKFWKLKCKEKRHSFK